ncbi:MAG TPA: nickel-responsive transcriptional regulator NikR [Actinobacteria bacterium]|nr:nickel-responsive transcriptional regulator NikR [Actinomycetota bacterium]
MDKVIRFGVSIEEKLLKEFDSLIKEKNYINRSEAIRDLIREKLIREEWDNSEKEAAGAIIIVYDHHKRELVQTLISIQHDYQNLIISSQHIHFDHNNCMEMIAVRGNTEELKELESKLKSEKGVKHTVFAKSTLGETI